MDLNPEKIITPVKELLRQAREVGKAAIDSLDSQHVAINIAEIGEQKEISEATVLKGIGEHISDPDLVTSQAKVIAHLTVKGMVRRSTLGDEVCPEDLRRLRDVLEDLPVDQTLETLDLREEELTEIRQYLQE